MIIVIDGYNFLKLLAGNDHVSESERSAFVNLLGRYRARRGHKVIVIFDAGPCTFPLREKQHGVEIIFSGEYQTADDVIINFVQERPNKDILVVTADREIISAVRGGNTEVVDPETFHYKIKEVLQKKSSALKKQNDGSVTKLSEESNEMLDALMYEVAVMGIPDKDLDNESTPSVYRSGGRKSPRKQRKKMKKLERL